MRIVETPLPGVLLLEPKVIADTRGFFLESYQQQTMASVGINEVFVQDNHSYSTRNVLRGLHYQIGKPQGKLVRVISGAVLDVFVDLRRSSKTFGEWRSARLSGDNKRMLWVPPGFAHGFHVVSNDAHVLYKATAFYDPAAGRTIAWNDPHLKIEWELNGPPVISEKDRKGTSFEQADKFS